VSKVEKSLRNLRNNPENAQFAELFAVCVHFFGTPHHDGGSHIVFRTGLLEDPRIVIQSRGKSAKGYQVRQVLMLIDKMERDGNHD
jgi:hypothetical protein